ncbi:TonB-dependent siderophore receptor [Sphingomonas sp.]|uniref:TonB-dependent siderophore receptor n=1 Tax=Sphingomonas sp. TaxID=28214 RepID=UPI0031D68B00
MIATASAQAQERPTDDVVVVGQRITIGAKDPRPVKDVPQTITVVTQEEIQLRNLFTLEDVMLATPGVTVLGISSEGQNYISRGFSLDAYLIDGVPLISYPGTRPDMTVYERAEILRGPSSLFSGAAQPGGAINLVRKRPTSTFAVSGTALAGSWNNFRGEFDIGGPVTADGTVKARFAASAQDSDMFYDYGKRRRYVAYGIVTFDLDPAVTLSIGAHHQIYYAPIQTGLPGYVGGGLLSVRRSVYVGANWNRMRDSDTLAFTELAWNINDDWRFKATAQRAKQDSYSNYAYLGNGAVRRGTGSTSMVGYYGQYDSDWTSFDAHVAGKIRMFGRDHSVLLGADHQRLDNDGKEWRDRAFARIDVFNPDNAVPRPAYKPNSGSLTRTRQTGIYGNIDLSLTSRLDVIGGARLSWWEQHERDGFTRVTPSLTNPQPIRLGPWTEVRMKPSFRPFGAVTYDVTKDWKAYVSYADSLSPQTERTVDGDMLSPTSGQQWEAGLKGQILDDRLLLTTAIYRIKQIGRALADPLNEGFYVAEGEVVSRGAELEVRGRITKGWLVTGGYAYNTNKYARDPANQDLAFTRISPKHSVKLFTNYVVEDGALSGVELGGGLNFSSPTQAGNARATVSTLVTQGSVLTLDGLVGYQLSDRLTVRLNVNNLLDRTYYSRISGTGRGNYFGEPRSFAVSLRARW